LLRRPELGKATALPYHERFMNRLTTLMFALLGFGTQAFAQPKVVAYVPNWIDLKSFAETIDYAKLTHINIAFENPRNAAGELSFNPANLSLIARARANHVKILVSIGGGSASSDKVMLNRYFYLLNETNRAGFVAELADYVVTNQFDGLDVDIEGPSVNDDYGAFIHDLAQALKPKGKLLTAALSKGYGGNKVPDSVFADFDFINIMAYDGAGPWSPESPGQHSSFEYATNNVVYWLDRGLPKHKAVLGVPFYGYGFGSAFRNRDYSYKAILAEHQGAEKLDQVGNTIWYNGIPTIKAKSRYVIEQQLGGIMIWSLDYDVPGERSLLNAIHETLKAQPTK
jgi:chitinase